MSDSNHSSSSFPSFQKDSPMAYAIRNFLALEQPKEVWKERLDRFMKPRPLISTFLAASAFYCFVIGRDRYTSVSEFVIQQAAPLQGWICLCFGSFSSTLPGDDLVGRWSISSSLS